jgi:hypothetical protein
MRIYSAILILVACFSGQALAQCPPRPGAPPNWCAPVMRPQVPAMPRPMTPQTAVPTAPNNFYATGTGSPTMPSNQGYNAPIRPGYGGSPGYVPPGQGYGVPSSSGNYGAAPSREYSYQGAPARTYDQYSSQPSSAYRYTCEIDDDEDDAGDVCDVYRRSPVRRGSGCSCSGQSGTIQ